MPLEWSRENSKKLINLLVQQECLWDVSSPTYHDRVKRENAFKSILNKMKQNLDNIRISDIKNKILSLRSQYRKELRAINASRRSGVGNEDIRHPKLWCFDELDFLRPSIYIRQSTYNIPKRKTPETHKKTYESNEEDDESFSVSG
ncbi:PREDICTED: uncharacterized protein LOC108355626 [Rhagoletis zephyria]|uniref:uncharacterized protein LOC108355626 n=1 Tax=Rhagoletis zephyria TaxID=28612 RepID=UPI0008117BA5|nr:PREDICTED: uncharacterized protein LOC108355626 [Rhagoletis zephyria]